MRSAAAATILEKVFRLAEPCRICPRRCGALRLSGETGACGAGPTANLFMEYVHWGEDADIVPAQTLYLTGCNLDCAFCQTGQEMRAPGARPLTPGLFREILDNGAAAGAKTVNILGGEPTVNAPALVELFTRTGDFPGLVWNTNFYGEAEIFSLLDTVVDIYMGDVKFGNSACAERLCGRADAGGVAMARALEIFSRRPDALIVRHLVLPGHFSCCTRPVLEWIASHLPGVRVSLKTGYLPPDGMRDCPERRFLRDGEIRSAFQLAGELGLRLTRDATLPEENASEPPSSGREFEIVLSPEGEVYVRHVTREAAALINAVR